MEAGHGLWPAQRVFSLVLPVLRWMMKIQCCTVVYKPELLMPEQHICAACCPVHIGQQTTSQTICEANFESITVTCRIKCNSIRKDNAVSRFSPTPALSIKSWISSSGSSAAKKPHLNLQRRAPDFTRLKHWAISPPMSSAIQIFITLSRTAKLQYIQESVVCFRDCGIEPPSRGCTTDHIDPFLTEERYSS